VHHARRYLIALGRRGHSLPDAGAVHPRPAGSFGGYHKTRLQAKPRILRLLDLEFLTKGTNLVLLGNPGVGKTFLAKIIAWRACQANQRVLFTAAMDMLNHLLASQVDHSLVRKLRTYTEPSLLICD
jgi:DNA replication protein DnaC